MPLVVKDMGPFAMTSDTRLFPIMVPPSIAERAVIGDIMLGQSMTIVCAIPWAMIEPHARQAKRNHRLSLEDIALRGGLDASEALAVLKGWPAFDRRSLPWSSANASLVRLLARALAPELTAA